MSKDELTDAEKVLLSAADSEKKVEDEAPAERGSQDELNKLLGAPKADKVEDKPARRSRPVRRQAEDSEPAEKPEDETPSERGTLSPAQYDDDGWNNLPVQMRG